MHSKVFITGAFCILSTFALAQTPELDKQKRRLVISEKYSEPFALVELCGSEYDINAELLPEDFGDAAQSVDIEARKKMAALSGLRGPKACIELLEQFGPTGTKIKNLAITASQRDDMEKAVRSSEGLWVSWRKPENLAPCVDRLVDVPSDALVLHYSSEILTPSSGGTEWLSTLRVRYQPLIPKTERTVQCRVAMQDGKPVFREFSERGAP